MVNDVVTVDFRLSTQINLNPRMWVACRPGHQQLFFFLFLISASINNDSCCI